MTRLGEYRAYASTAARPYGRASWEGMVRRAGRVNKSAPDGTKDICTRVDQIYANAWIDGQTGVDYWEGRAPVKPANVLTTVSDNARASVRGAALVVTDDDQKLVYEKRSVKPLCIVMTGWGGYVTIDAMRFCSDYNISVVILDWNRSYMTAVLSAPKHTLIREQMAASPLSIAREIILAKVSEHAAVKAIEPSIFRQAKDRLGRAITLEHVLIAEAQAARSAWVTHSIALKWREAGTIPKSWKLPYGLRRRMTGKSAREATDPINCLLNLSLAVTIGRLTVAIVARGLSPSVGYLHKSPRWALNASLSAAALGLELPMIEIIPQRITNTR